MPQTHIYETAVTIDYELGTCWVDTTMKRVANDLRRRGFTEITKANNQPYRRFLGGADQVRFRMPKGKRALRGAAANLAAGNTLRGTKRATKEPTREQPK